MNWSTDQLYSWTNTRAARNRPIRLRQARANASYTNSAVTSIGGNATDLFSLQNVSVKLMQLTGTTTNYLTTAGNWQGTDPGQHPNVAVSGTNASWNLASVNSKAMNTLITANMAYQVVPIATNSAGLIQQVLSTSTFVYDVLAPTATITYPTPGGYVSASGQVSGTTLDTAPGISSNVYVRISTNTHQSFWTGSSWTLTTNTWLQATLHPGNRLVSRSSDLPMGQRQFPGRSVWCRRGRKPPADLFDGQLHSRLHQSELDRHMAQPEHAANHAFFGHSGGVGQ